MPKSTGPSPAIERGLRQLTQHNAVAETGAPDVHASGAVTVLVNVRVALPNAWMAKGMSPNGVRSVEPVTIWFPAAYPLAAPILTLRQDFDRSLAHLQPGDPDDPPEPCIVDGTVVELLQHRGLMGVLDQLVLWLENAALGHLIDPNHGWEPVRRDALGDVVVADASHLRRQVTRQGGRAAFRFDYMRAGGAGDDDLIAGVLDPTPLPLSSETVKKAFSERDLEGDGDYARGRSVGLVVWPGKLPSGAPFVASDYEPETVTTLGSLFERAQRYGCEHELRGGLTWLGKCVAKLKGKWRWPLAVILLPRRPFPLIGSDSTMEICPYIVEIRVPELFPEGEATKVRTAAHRDTVSVPLLRRLSGLPPDLQPRPWVLLGAGSLGSKIGLHLARAGMAPTAIIDQASLRPHNAARHGLVPHGGLLSKSWMGAKAKALADAIDGLNQSATPINRNIVSLLRDQAERRRIFPRRTGLLVNAAATLVAREALGAEPADTLPPVAEAMLYADGVVGILTVEGNGRNPNCLDLIAEAHAAISDDPRLRRLVLTGTETMSRQRIGEGCGSLTMAISDARISMMAAPMAEAVRALLQASSGHDHGRILIGSLAPDGLGVTWTSHDVAPVTVLDVDEVRDWTVRISARAHAAIVEEAARWPSVETGGILIGRLSESAQSIHVIDVIPAPADSVRSPDEFVLGTQGVRTKIGNVADRTGGTLYCLGTWHSHLSASGPSARDRATATTIALARLAPSVLLIHTQRGYRALLADSLSTQEGTS
jgi:hypothetical protein